jgi:hypothetical protein
MHFLIFLFNSIDKSAAQSLDGAMQATQTVLLVVNHR